MPDPLVLGFDTSAAHCAAVLLRGDSVLAERHEEMGKGQAERLMPMLEEVLAEGGADWAALDRIGVGVGPGNFTGIRLSVSAARGLALALKIPAVGVSVLDALALGSKGPLVACLDARRGKVFLQVFGQADSAPVMADLDALPDGLQGLPCIGSGAEAVAAITGGPVYPARYAPASAIARIAAVRPADNIDRPAPLYLRQADAAPPRDAPPAILP
ncbi:tRNA (adenosine(37)-N6)-threonylcarbamoyltransferase complex dimerization subunit type 1 TsaB [Psychromarinibacter sp. S121]|uniref:tRNA (adenosine(37)-N6)-threonylcarbamoyltransferase complex dimerization subunit type 1 TsaB n=1 Tax=Psychromarinibacter sp. S121 TaxID=3415127 RepID=UPI003C7BCADF